MEQSFKQRMRPFRFLFFIVVAPLAIFLFGTLVMYLWNALLPALFHFPTKRLPLPGGAHGLLPVHGGGRVAVELGYRHGWRTENQ